MKNSECKVTHISKKNKNFKYYIGEDSNKSELEVTNLEKDLGVNIDPLPTIKNRIEISQKIHC